MDPTRVFRKIASKSEAKWVAELFASVLIYCKLRIEP